MHCDHGAGIRNPAQTFLNRVMAIAAASHHVGDLGQLIGFFQLSHVVIALFGNHDDDLIDAGGILKGMQCMPKDWLVAKWGKQLVKTHAAALASGYDDRGNTHNRLAKLVHDHLGKLLIVDAPRCFFL